MVIKKKFRTISALLLAAALLCSNAWAVSDAPSGILSSVTQSAETSRTVTWLDSGEYSESLQVVTAEDYAAHGFENALTFAAECRDISLDGSGEWHYEATATGLTAGTEYVYRVGSEGRWSDSVSFTTSSASDSVTFAYFGDAQTYGDTAEDYAKWQTLTENVLGQNPELAFGIMGGDNVNSGISVSEFRLFRESASSVFASVPLFSTVGNHESNFLSGKPELYLDEFAFPTNGPEGFEEEFYSFDVGNCHILVVNSWVYSGEQKLSEAELSAIGDWIAEDLATSTADWQIVVTHVPVYAVHSDTTAEKLKANWAPIFEQYGVDLVLEGHQHVYSRSYPMYQGQIDYENGIQYIMGVSGSKSYSSADETFAERTVYETPNCQIIRTDGATMTVQTVDTDGNELDYAAITQRGVTVTRGEYLNTLWKAAGSPTPSGKSPFTDTDDPAVIWGYETGIINGYGGGRFGANDQITQWQIKLITQRMEAAA